HEITEAWEEARAVLGLLLLFTILANGLVFFTIGRALQPIDAILKALDRIERGDYRSRLPSFTLPELDVISQKFNDMAEVLQQSRKDNRYLTQRSLAIQEAERRHLAHELHDELGQSISAIKAVAVSLNRPEKRNSASMRDRAQAIISFSSHMYDVVRNMMRRLRPVVLDELGLVAALQDTIDDWNVHHEEVFCRFETAGALHDLGEAVNISIYRIVQESLTNIAKHSKASKVDIALELVDGAHGTDSKTHRDNGGSLRRVELVIQDNGQGFHLHKTRPGLGLLGMRERAEALNGEFVLESSPGAGVALQVTIPIEAKVWEE
ncbi:MAG: histidine kinase, partial [Gammaproteobacteria bacterium]|nr:histidine kinase [Gammaproteobacteria bacterium]